MIAFGEGLCCGCQIESRVESFCGRFLQSSAGTKAFYCEMFSGTLVNALIDNVPVKEACHSCSLGVAPSQDARCKLGTVSTSNKYTLNHN